MSRELVPSRRHGIGLDGDELIPVRCALVDGLDDPLVGACGPGESLTTLGHAYDADDSVGLQGPGASS